MTYTYAILGVSRVAWEEIKRSLTLAGHADRIQDDRIDMHALALEVDIEALPVVGRKLSGWYSLATLILLPLIIMLNAWCIWKTLGWYDLHRNIELGLGFKQIVGVCFAFSYLPSYKGSKRPTTGSKYWWELWGSFGVTMIKLGMAFALGKVLH